MQRAGRRRYLLRWRDPLTNGWREVASSIEVGKKNRGAAEREAQKHEAALRESERKRLAGVVDSDMSWAAFCERYESDHQSSLARQTQNAWHTAKNAFNSHCKVTWLLEAATTAQLVSFGARLRKAGLSENTVATYMRTIHAALGWADDLKLLPLGRPKLLRPARAKGKTKHMRSRPITGEEFDRLLETAAARRPDDHAHWRFMLEGMFWGSLRLSEALLLSWDLNTDIGVMIDGKYF